MRWRYTPLATFFSLTRTPLIFKYVTRSNPSMSFLTSCFWNLQRILKRTQEFHCSIVRQKIVLCTNLFRTEEIADILEKQRRLNVYFEDDNDHEEIVDKQAREGTRRSGHWTDRSGGDSRPYKEMHKKQSSYMRQNIQRGIEALHQESSSGIHELHKLQAQTTMLPKLVKVSRSNHATKTWKKRYHPAKLAPHQPVVNNE